MYIYTLYERGDENRIREEGRDEGRKRLLLEERHVKILRNKYHHFHHIVSSVHISMNR